MSNTFNAGQTFLDKVLELTGDVTNSLAMAALNDVSLTDSFSIGTEIKATAVTNRYMVELFSYAPPATKPQQEAVTTNFYLLPQLFPLM